MSGFKDYHQFLKKNSKKKNMCSVLKNTHGLGLKSVRKVNLLNGKAMQSFSKVINITPEMFEKLKVQVSFFYNLEKNKIFNNVKKKKTLKVIAVWGIYFVYQFMVKEPILILKPHVNI